MSKFSIVIPALNEEKFLPSLLASLAQQTKKDFEVIVVDGSSKDDTVAVARSFASELPKLQVHVSEEANLPLQRNIGARISEGEWLLFVDADSIFLPYSIERLEHFIREQDPKFFTMWFRPDSEVSWDAIFTLFSNVWFESALALQRPVAPGPFAAVRREIFELVGGYNETLTFGEDYDFSQRIVARGIVLQILRETLCIISLRRLRRDGKLRYIWLMTTASLLVLFTKRNLKRVPSYIMGGHLYETEKHER